MISVARSLAHRLRVRVPVRHLSAILTLGVSSVGAFSLTVIAARALGPESFGVWAWGWLIAYSSAAFHNAIVQTPLTVLTPMRAGGVSAVRLSAFLRIHLAVTPLIALAGAVVGLLIVDFADGAALGFAAIAVLIVAQCTAEFVRRLLFSREMIGAAVAVEVTRVVAMVVVVALLVIGAHTSDPVVLLLAAGSASLAVTVAGAVRLLELPRRPPTLAMWRRSLKLSRWTALLALSQRLGGDVPYAVITGALGLLSMGSIRAMQQLLNVASALNSAMQITLTGDMARLHQEARRDELRNAWLRGSSLMALLGLAIIAGAWLLGPIIVSLLLSDQFASHQYLLPVLAAGTAGMLAAAPSACLLSSTGNAHWQLNANLIAGAAAAVAAWPVTQFGGAFGAAILLAVYSLGEAALLAAFSLMVLRRRRG